MWRSRVHMFFPTQSSPLTTEIFKLAGRYTGAFWLEVKARCFPSTTTFSCNVSYKQILPCVFRLCFSLGRPSGPRCYRSYHQERFRLHAPFTHREAKVQDEMLGRRTRNAHKNLDIYPSCSSAHFSFFFKRRRCSSSFFESNHVTLYWTAYISVCCHQNKSVMSSNLPDKIP